jgi:hypothetical protein
MTVSFICDITGIETVYTYNTNRARGVVKVELNYPKEYLKEIEQKEKVNAKLPKCRQKFVNPITGKEVSYYRAKTLGLIK